METTDQIKHEPKQSVKPANDRHRQVIKGIVVSDKMAKTRIIEIKRAKEHRLYQKKLVRRSRLFIHDEKNESKVGDLIQAVATRPLSKNKSFRLVKILEKRVEE
jgi:small subunit ribosomal protein S17